MANIAIFALTMDKKTLKIGFDAKRAVLNDTGLGNYSRRVIDELSRMHGDWQLRLYTPRMREQPRLESILGRRGVAVALPSGMWRHASGLWRVRGGLTADLRRDGIELFHGLSNELPLDIARAGVASVVTIHDVIYRRCPDNYTAIDRRLYDWKYGRSARNATRIVAISKRTAADIVELYDVDPAKIDIIYQSCHPQFAQPVSDVRRAELRSRYALPQRYIALVGTVERRKNAMLAVRALPMIDPEVKLVIVGRSRQGYAEEVIAEARRMGVAGRLVMIEGMPFDLLPALYAGAEVAAYPSRYEGFGLPVVEALSAGTPVIAATGSCLEEAGGPGAIYVDPDDAEGFAAAACRLLADAGLRRDMAQRGRRHVAALTAVPMAEALTATYLKALGRRQG